MTPYELVKDEMETGDLLQWRSHRPMGAAIRFGQKMRDVLSRKYCSNTIYPNHSSLVIRFEEYKDRVFHGEACGKGVLPVRLSGDLASFDGEVWWHKLTPEWQPYRHGIGENMVSMFGQGYDFLGCVGNLWKKVSANSRRLYCSEYCFIAAKGDTGKDIAPRPVDMPFQGIWEVQGVQIK